MKPKIVLCAAALAFVGHAVAAKPISMLPASITSPGTYQVTANLISSGASPAITINSPTAGKIILDLSGFSLAEGPGFNIPGVYILNPTNSTILVKNGSLNSFFTGIQVNDAALATAWVTGIQIQNVTFNSDGRAAVFFYQANGCSVTSCAFAGQSTFGIEDLSTQTGNKYLDNTFDGGQATALSIGGVNFGDKLVIDCRASPVP